MPFIMVVALKCGCSEVDYTRPDPTVQPAKVPRCQFYASVPVRFAGLERHGTLHSRIHIDTSRSGTA